MGSVGSALTGAFPFVFALILGEIMSVSTCYLVQVCCNLGFSKSVTGKTMMVNFTNIDIVGGNSIRTTSTAYTGKYRDFSRRSWNYRPCQNGNSWSNAPG